MISGSNFFINTQDGRVALRRQLDDAGLVDAETDKPEKPWHPIKGPGDASTMWYAVMRKQMRGVFIGMLCIRHLNRQASLEADGWVEVPWDTIGVESSANATPGSVTAVAQQPQRNTGD